jgi:hypothetical protein
LCASRGCASVAHDDADPGVVVKSLARRNGSPEPAMSTAARAGPGDLEIVHLDARVAHAHPDGKRPLGVGPDDEAGHARAPNAHRRDADGGSEPPPGGRDQDGLARGG